jgi:hypothetical protein
MALARLVERGSPDRRACDGSRHEATTFLTSQSRP